MISIEALFSLIEEDFVYLLAVDEDEQVIHTSIQLQNDFWPPDALTTNLGLTDVLGPASQISFRRSIDSLKGGKRKVRAQLSTLRRGATSLPMHARTVSGDAGTIYLFCGAPLDTLAKPDDWEKEERIKELSCLYSVAEWIEASPTITDFFGRLDEYLAPGMRFPEHAIVHSVYNGTPYGHDLERDEYISVALIVNKIPKGEIRIGYPDSTHALLPEEQRMLGEIGRMLSSALEKKELAEAVSLTMEEQKIFQATLRKLESEVKDREEELESQKQKLSTADSYLNRVNHDWGEASRRLETMFQAIPDPVMLMDLNLNVVMTNQPEIERGEKCYRTYFNRDKPCEDCRLQSVIRNKTPITITMRKDERYLQVHMLPVYNQNEEVDGILEFFRDITLEKTYEQQIQQADKLASLGQLVSGIGHEINNPNQFIRGNVKIVRQALTDMIPIVDDHYADNPDLKIAKLKYTFFKDHIMTLVDDMMHGSERIKGIVDGLRGFARKDEGLLVDTVDVNTLIGATTRLVQNEVHKHAEIELELGDAVVPFTGNSQKIEQVLVNLIVNAAQAIPDDRKGRIRVRTRMEDDQIIIAISDNGKGMDEKTRKQIFDPFFTTKRTKGGTGLGLAIAFRIIEEHGGNIAVSSQIDVGTTFKVKIPAPASTEERAV